MVRFILKFWIAQVALLLVSCAAMPEIKVSVNEPVPTCIGAPYRSIRTADQFKYNVRCY
jgi:hypothetical protein